jgi:hypothetical protein
LGPLSRLTPLRRIQPVQPAGPGAVRPWHCGTAAPTFPRPILSRRPVQSLSCNFSSCCSRLRPAGF